MTEPVTKPSGKKQTKTTEESFAVKTTTIAKKSKKVADSSTKPSAPKPTQAKLSEDHTKDI